MLFIYYVCLFGWLVLFCHFSVEGLRPWQRKTYRRLYATTPRAKRHVSSDDTGMKPGIAPHTSRFVTYGDGSASQVNFKVNGFSRSGKGSTWV